MSAVEAFHLVWVQARNTLGNGAPQRGEDFDRSGELTDLAQTVDTAAPRDQWAGGAAIAYARA
ncbi:EspA/EspE family type VII secretion system effector, partial [Mycolicibacterium hassiacum]